MQELVIEESFLDCGGRPLDLSHPQVMGIVNLAPDSYCPVGRCSSADEAVRVATEMVEAGAAIIDVGGEPTNPQINPMEPLQAELDRVIPVVERLHRELDVPISVDTSKPEVIQESITMGAGLINDVRALRLDGAVEAVASNNIPVCLMHMLYPYGMPAQQNTHPLDGDIVSIIKTFLQSRINTCLEAGIPKSNIVIDPGFGGGSFGKDTHHNLKLMKHLDKFCDMGYPLLIGVSRKTFVGALLNEPVENRLFGSLAAATIALMKGASIIRAHDVKATKDTIVMVEAMMSEE